MRMVQFFRRLCWFPVLIAGAALLMLMVMTFADVVLRSVFNSPIEAATELTRICVAIIVFAVLPELSVTGGHIAVDLTDGQFKTAGLDGLRDGILHIVCGVLMLWPLQRVWVLAERWRDYGDITEYLSIPQFLIGWFICACLVLTMIAMIVTGILQLFAPHILEENTP